MPTDTYDTAKALARQRWESKGLPYAWEDLAASFRAVLIGVAQDDLLGGEEDVD